MILFHGVGLLGFARAGQAQAPVLNDNLADRLPLRLGEARESRTDGCTVEWGCVDEKLTNQLIDYHNDQWFSFRPPRAGQYYVNLSGQRCRQTRGVQLVMLTAGEVCVPSTYAILSATSLGTQDDIFVSLSVARANQEILLCVDGYLRDYCQFRIAVDTTARGVPVANPGLTTEAATRVVTLRWELPDSLAGAASFRVMRRPTTAPRAAEIAALPVVRNAAGSPTRAYSLRDTLPTAGQYVYQIIAEGAGAPVLVQQRTVAWRAAEVAPLAPVALPLDRFRPGARLTLVVADAFSGRVLSRLALRRPRRGAAPTLPVADYQRQEIQRLRLSIREDAPGRGGAGGVEMEVALPAGASVGGP